MENFLIGALADTWYQTNIIVGVTIFRHSISGVKLISTRLRTQKP